MVLQRQQNILRQHMGFKNNHSSQSYSDKILSSCTDNGDGDDILDLLQHCDRHARKMSSSFTVTSFPSLSATTNDNDNVVYKHLQHTNHDSNQSLVADVVVPKAMLDIDSSQSSSHSWFDWGDTQSLSYRDDNDEVDGQVRQQNSR